MINTTLSIYLYTDMPYIDTHRDRDRQVLVGLY